MVQEKKKTSDPTKQGLVVEGDEHQKSSQSMKIETYLMTLPSSVKNLADIPDKKMSDPQYHLEEEQFGLGPLVFPCLQRFNNINSFMTMFFFGTMIHGIIIALVDLTLKIFVFRFAPSKSQELVMSSGDYLAAFLVSLIVAHFGGRGNRAKWVAAACFVTGLASMVFVIPFFNYEVIRIDEVKDELCIVGKEPRVCGGFIIPHKSTCIYSFTFGQFLHGIASMPIYLLGVTFIFDHVPTSSSGLYLAIADSALQVGYIVGFLIGAQNFKFPVEEAMKAVGPLHRLQMLQRGWWTSFLSIAIISFCTATLLLCFPSHLPGVHKIRLEKSMEPPTIDRRLKDKEIQPDLKGVLHAIWCLLRNPLVLTQAFCQVTDSLTLQTSIHFLPKFLSTQFLMTPKTAFVVTGMFLIPGSLLGHFLGGYIVDILQMSSKMKLKFIMMTSIVSVLFFLLTFSVSCETVKFAGINDDYDGLGKLGNLSAPCNEHCGCTTFQYSAICGRDERQYFSPCFAGCKADKHLTKEKTYYNCSCIKEGLTTADNQGQFFDAVSGTCDTGCNALPLFFAVYFSATVFSNFCTIPSILVILQSVPANWNSMSLGVTYTIWRFVGFLSGPLLFEATSDFICNFWDTNSCGKKVRCWIYIKKNLIFTFKSIWVSMKISSCLLCLYANFRYDSVVTEKTKSPIKKEKAKGEEKA